MKKYAVGINGSVVTWKDGKFESEDKELLDKIKAEAEDFESNPMKMISLDGSILCSGGSIDPEENWVSSYALLQTMTGGRMEFIAGDRPTWEAMGHKLPEGAVP